MISSYPTHDTPLVADQIRVMLVDDSAVIRGLLARSLEADPDIRIVASVGDGMMALSAVQRHEIDVMVLDIEMPNMDGMTALPKILKVAPHIKIIMASTLTRRNAEISIKALENGAADYLTKPSSMRELDSAEAFKRDLRAKIRALGLSIHRKSRHRTRTPISRADRLYLPSSTSSIDATGKIALRPMPTATPRAIAIGASTGGPQALLDVLGHLGNNIHQPVFLTQHMPATFTTILAEHITRKCGISCAEARDGESVEGGRIYLAPGDYHMTFRRTESQAVISLNQNAPENYCRPAVDPMLRSAVDVFGSRVLTTILTGMGRDGLKGCQAVVDAGGAVLAQDEKTSVVWGMPGSVATAGLCSAVLPVQEIGPVLFDLAGGSDKQREPA
ncbi:MAG: chemotaxis response regulator protein-glutamate methylesterase [Pseudomonadota bacterium]|nr:chemotaxis response regulator protein-glutamate methylesterase [Pseudomonadota bacterium]